jgi:hypothetical protein
MTAGTASLRYPRLLVILGLVAVVAGTIVEMRTFVGFTFDSRLIISLALPIGYCLVGLAWWQLWTPDPIADPAVAKRLGRFSRSLAAASTVTAIGFLAQVYGDLRFRYSWPKNLGGFYLPHFRLEVACPAVIAVGLLLAASGFWLARHIADPANLTRDDPDAVGVGTEGGSA